MLCFDTEKWTNSHGLIYYVFCESIFYKTPTFSITFSIILRLLELLRFPNSWRNKCNSWRNNCVGAKSLGRATERSPWDGCRDEILGGYRYTPRILNELIPTKMAMFFLPEPTLLQTIMLEALQPLGFRGRYWLLLHLKKLDGRPNLQTSCSKPRKKNKETLKWWWSPWHKKDAHVFFNFSSSRPKVQSLAV